MAVDSTSDPGRADSGRRRRLWSSPVAAVAAAFALGIACAGLPPATEAGAVTRIPALIIAAALCLAAGAELARAGHDGWAWAALLAGFALAGAAAALLFAFRLPPNDVSHLEAWGADASRPVRFEGWLLSDPIPTPTGIQFDAQATRLSQAGAQPFERILSGKVRIRVASIAAVSNESLELRQGDTVEAWIRLRRPRVYANPGGFDFRQRAADIEDLFWEGTADRGAGFRKLPVAPARSLAHFEEAARRRIRRTIDRLYPPWSPEGRDGAVLKAVLLGDRTSLDSATLDGFRSTGLYHLLVVAGLHVGLIASLVLGVLCLFGVHKTPRYVILLMVLLAFALLVEQRAPTERATLMIVVFVLARLLDRDYSPLNSVGVAALFLLLARPAWLFETGFQLTFAAAIVIVTLAGPLLNATIEPYRRALRHPEAVAQDAALAPRAAQFRLDLRMLTGYLRRRFRFCDRHPQAAWTLVGWPVKAALGAADLVLLSAVLQVGLLLPMAETFHRVTLAGAGLNALAVPLMGLLLALAIPTVALATAAPALAAWPAKGLAVVFTALFSVATMPHLPGWLSYRVPQPPVVVAAGFALTLVAAAVTLRRSRGGFLLSCLGFALFAILLATDPFPAKVPSGLIELTSLDCGGGLAHVVVVPDRSVVLAGACGEPRRLPGGRSETRRWDPGENVVSPYLWSRNIKAIDALAILDSGEGSLDGYQALLRNFQVRRLWYRAGRPAGRSGAGEGRLNSVLDFARQRGVQVHEVTAEENFDAGGATIRMMAAAPNLLNSGSETGGALVLRIARGGNSALVAGRILSADASSLARLGPQLHSRAFYGDRSMLGSAAALALLGRIAPQVFVVASRQALGEDAEGSAGAGGVLPRGCVLLQTARDGAVSVVMGETSLEVRTFRGFRLSLR